MKRLLLHPRTTLAAMIAGISSLATGFVATIIALRSVDELGVLALHPFILRLDFVLGIFASICLVLTAIGRSILVFVDDDGLPPGIPAPQIVPPAKAA